MGIWESLLMGLVQGITEFLPVSSSGHLTLSSLVLGLDEEHIMSFTTMLHMGTLLAVFVVMRKELLALLRRPFSKLTGLLILGTIPAVAAALLFGDFIEEAFGGAFLGPSFFITAAVLLVNLFFRAGSRLFPQIGWLDALVTGIAQAIAILPGVSRSGSTITAALSRGIEREAAIRFSFLLSIPAILGGFALDLYTLLRDGGGLGGTPWGVTGAGVAMAAVSGFLCMRFMLKKLTRRGMVVCAAYVACLGAFLVLDKAFWHLVL